MAHQQKEQKRMPRLSLPISGLDGFLPRRNIQTAWGSNPHRQQVVCFTKGHVCVMLKRTKAKSQQMCYSSLCLVEGYFSSYVWKRAVTLVHWKRAWSQNSHQQMSHPKQHRADHCRFLVAHILSSARPRRDLSETQLQSAFLKGCYCSANWNETCCIILGI